MIYSQNKKVSAFFCGADAKLSTIGALALIEDSLTELMGELELDGVTVIKKYNALLLFTKNKVIFTGSANWKDDITVSSFISFKSLAKLHIDTVIKKQSDIVAYSRIEICAIDLETKKIRKVESIGVTKATEVHDALIDLSFSKKQPIDMEFVESVLVRSSNIDYAQHTNNIEYVRFLINTMPVKTLVEHPLKSMQLDYLSQSHEGDTLKIYRAVESDKCDFEIRLDDKPVFSCEMIW